MNNIWLIRHGESLSNLGERTASPELVGLSDKGKKQSEQIAQLIDTQPNLVVYSPFIRTKSTAQPVIDKYPDSLFEEWPIQEFTYLSTEKYHNTTRFERVTSKTVYWEKCDANYKDGEGAESYNEFLARVEVCINKLKKQQGFVLVYTHGHVIRTIMWYMLFNSMHQLKDNLEGYSHLRSVISIPNGAILKVNFNENDSGLSTILTDHLLD